MQLQFFPEVVTLDYARAGYHGKKNTSLEEKSGRVNARLCHL